MLPIEQLQPYLVHSWTFKRWITHHQIDQTATVEGTVCWGPIADQEMQSRHLYLERGVIQIDTYTGPMTQTYQYTFPAPAAADVYFNDGRFFYTLDLTTGQCELHHLCGQDTYRGRVEVRSETEHQYVWHVNGPRKDYTSRTTFFRMVTHDP